MEHAQKMKTAKPFLPGFRKRAARLAMDHRDEYQSQAAALTAMAGKSGWSPDGLCVWIRQVQRENRALRQANEIQTKASAYFAQAELPPVSQMAAVIDEHREMYRVEPILNGKSQNRPPKSLLSCCP